MNKTILKNNQNTNKMMINLLKKIKLNINQKQMFKELINMIFILNLNNINLNKVNKLA